MSECMSVIQKMFQLEQNWGNVLGFHWIWCLVSIRHIAGYHLWQHGASLLSSSIYFEFG